MTGAEIEELRRHRYLYEEILQSVIAKTMAPKRIRGIKDLMAKIDEAIAEHDKWRPGETVPRDEKVMLQLEGPLTFEPTPTSVKWDGPMKFVEGKGWMAVTSWAPLAESGDH